MNAHISEPFRYNPKCLICGGQACVLSAQVFPCTINDTFTFVVMHMDKEVKYLYK